MAFQSAYAIITPHTIRKSRTGAVLSRLLGRVSAPLVGAQMIALDAAMAERFAASIRPGLTPQEEKYRSQFREYIRENLGPGADGRRHRSLMLVFAGENARDELVRITGHFISCDSGETIRDAFGDLIWNPDGTVRYFEPAVLISEEEESLDLWLDFLREQPAVLDKVCSYEHPAEVQQTLVLIKPDSWRQRSSRPGAILDMFSRTGLRIIGCKVVRMSVAQAMDFYGPVKEALCRKLSPSIGQRARELLEGEFGFQLPAAAGQALSESVGVPFATDQFERIVEFMAGRRPSACPAELRDAEGQAPCLGLIYEGENAVQKIRDVLGPTDPSKAPNGTVRREFGSDVMVNTAHASDSPDNARREMRILRMHESGLVPLIECWKRP